MNNDYKLVLEELSKVKSMVLATSYNDKVTARSISTIVESGFIYFQTDKNMEKYQQFTKNKNVALSIGFFQIEGIATDIGSWQENRHLLESYQQKHKASYEKYKEVKTETVIKIEINKVKHWKYIDDIPFELIYEPLLDKFSKSKYLIYN